MITVLTGDQKNTNVYPLLSDSDIKNDNLIRSKPFIVVILICFITSIVIHSKIEIFKKHVDSQSEAGEKYQEGNCEYSMNTVRIIMCIGSTLILILILYMLNVKTEIENLYLRRHKALALIQFFNLNVIPMIFIVRNVNMLYFFKNEIKTFSLYMVMCPLFVIHVLSCKKL